MKWTAINSREHRTGRFVWGSMVAVMVAVPALVMAQAPALTAEQIVQRLDRNLVFETTRAEASMTVRDRFGERTSTMVSYSRGRDVSLIEFTSAAERGQKVLRTADEIYLYYPDAAELVRLQGAALRESMLGSDVSYEDMTGGRTLLETYAVTLRGTETINGRLCYVLDLEARRRNVPYPRQTMWVDTERFLYWKSEQYALNRRLLKTLTVQEMQQVDGHWFATRMTISDALKRNSSTEMRVHSIQINPQLDPKLFSLEELSW